MRKIAHSQEFEILENSALEVSRGDVWLGARGALGVCKGWTVVQPLEVIRFETHPEVPPHARASRPRSGVAPFAFCRASCAPIRAFGAFVFGGDGESASAVKSDGVTFQCDAETERPSRKSPRGRPEAELGGHSIRDSLPNKKARRLSMAGFLIWR